MTICPGCYGTGQNIVMRFVRRYEKIRLPGKCPDCEGTGKKPTPKPMHIKSRMAEVRRKRLGWPETAESRDCCRPSLDAESPHPDGRRQCSGSTDVIT
jgi:DnaJ-class molecular chaperone